MSKSRVESFKEYRKNMIGEEEEAPEKTQIETKLQPTSSEASSSLTSTELILLKKIRNTKKMKDGIISNLFLVMKFIFVVMV